MRRSPHRPGDPLRGQEKQGIGWGGLLVGGTGCAFVAYVWNVGGLHTWLDEVFGGWNQTLRGHDDLVARWYLASLPVLGMLLAVVLGYALLSSVVGKLSRAHKRRRKARAQTPLAAAPASAAIARQKTSPSGAEFVRPVRLAGARDDSILVKTSR